MISTSKKNSPISSYVAMPFKSFSRRVLHRHNQLTTEENFLKPIREHIILPFSTNSQNPGDKGAGGSELLAGSVIYFSGLKAAVFNKSLYLGEGKVENPRNKIHPRGQVKD